MEILKGEGIESIKDKLKDVSNVTISQPLTAFWDKFGHCLRQREKSVDIFEVSFSSIGTKKGA